MATATIDQLSDATFEAEVSDAQEPIVVQFWAPWSSACRRTAPAFEAMAQIFGEEVRAARLNVDDHPQTAINYSVTNLPTFVLFEDGKACARLTGAASQKTLRQLFDVTA